MAALITVEDIQEHLEADMNPLALARLIDAADADIVESYGAHNEGGAGSSTDQYMGGDTGLFLNRAYATLTSVTETRGTVDTVLAADDYRVWHGNRTLERIATGTNPQSYWGERVVVVTVPFDDDAKRIMATIDLVKLALQYNGLRSERAGDYRSDSADFEKDRLAILRRLGRKQLIGG